MGQLELVLDLCIVGSESIGLGGGWTARNGDFRERFECP